MTCQSLYLKKYKSLNSSQKYLHLIAKYFLLLLLNVGFLHAEEYEGFTQPYHKADLSPTEAGVVSAILVKEGDAVSEGDLLLELDNAVLKASLKIADARQNSKGILNSAKARYRLHRSQLNKLLDLQQQGHAQVEEVEQARANASVAKADILTAEEELLVHKYEHERLQEQIKRRQLFSPFDGVVTRIYKNISELTNINSGPLIKVVQLNPLLLTIHVTLVDANKLSVGDEMMAVCQNISTDLSTKVEYISPITDPDSGTVRIKLLADNVEKTFPSGVKCIATI